MVEFGASIKLDSASALEQMRKFAEGTTAASKALRQFQNETKATAQGGGANVFRAYINSSQRANQQILKSITLIHDQRKAFSKLSDEQKGHVALADKLNLKYDEAARAERKLVNVRKELRLVTAAGLKTQKEADAIFNREAESIRKSTRAYKEKAAAKEKVERATKANTRALHEAMMAHNKEYAINNKVAAVKKQLILLLKNEKINRQQYNQILSESRVKITAVVRENHKLITSQQRMIKMARLVSVYSRLLLGAYAAIRVARAFTDFEKTAEAVELLQQKLEFLTGDSGAYKKLFAMTQEVGVKMESANKIITRFAVVTNRAFSIETMAEWSGTLIKSARATGTSTQEMTGALIQITQAMSAGRLMGDEYRSVTENLPLLTVALRDIFGRSTASLKELSSQGLITNEVMIEAFGRTKELLQGFPDSTQTIEAAFGRLSSAWDNLVSKISDTDISKDIANTLTDVFRYWADISGSGKKEDIQEKIRGNKIGVELIQKELDILKETRKIRIAQGGSKKFSDEIIAKTRHLEIFKKGLKDATHELEVFNGTDVASLAKKAADDKLQAERELDRVYKEQQKTLQFIEKIQGGKSIATIKAKSTLEQNLLEQKHNMFNLQEAGAIKDEEYFLLSENISKNRQISIDKVINKQIDAELRLEGFTTKNNINKIQEELNTTGKILSIKNKAEKARKSIESEERARELWRTKKDRTEKNKRGITGEKAKILTEAVDLKELKDIKEHIDSITTSINSVGDAAKANTAKMKGDITSALGFDKANIVSNYNKSIEELDKKLKQLKGTENDIVEIRRKNVAILKEQKDAAIFKKEEDFTSNLEQKFDAGATAIRAYNTEVIALTAAKDRLNLSEFEHNRQLDILNKAMEDQVNQSKSLRLELSQFDQVLLGMQKGMSDFKESTKTTFEVVSESTETLFDSMVDSIVIGGKEGEDAFRKMTISILNDIQKMIIKSLILKAITAFTGGFGGTTPGAMTPVPGGEIFAKGGVKSGPGISNYSNTVVNKPTIFPFAKGTGLMGEDGEEAIMPLTRLSNGDLGVGVAKGSGHSGDNNVTISVSIDQSGNTEQKVETSQNDGINLANVLSNVVNQQLIKEMRPGGILNRGGK